jgi:LPS-assembly protein
MILKKVVFVLLLIFHLVSISAFAVIEETEKTSTMIEADSIEYSTNKEIVTAKGNVEIFKNDFLLKADQVVYDKLNQKVTASGNVYILDPNGNETRAESLEIYRELKEAIIEHFNIRMADNSLFTAGEGKYFYPNRAQLKHAVYSPCPICEGNKYPQWQLAAKNMTIDNEAEQVRYKSGFFEIFGRPIIYTPFFSHPTPHAKPKSGFLMPKYRYTTVYGQGISIPYYWRIADNRDLKFAPIFTSRQGIIYTGEYNHLTESSFYTVAGSYNKAKIKSSVEPSNRYYGNIKGYTQINDQWRFNSDIQGTGDKSYLRNYFGDNHNYLTSQAELTYNQHRDYGVINSLYFQELRPIDQSTVPMILPVADYHKEFEGENNNRYTLDNNVLLLMRKQGSGTRRLSVTGTWSKTYFTNNGQQIGVYRRIRGDAYNFVHKGSAVPQVDQNNNGPNNVGRLIPEAEIKWSYPFINTDSGRDIFLEPIANLIASPYMPTVSDVIDEDSQEVEISDDNLFSANRYAGYDRVENGIRSSYGLNGYYHTSNNVVYNFLIGQSYRIRKDLEYQVDSGLQNNFSDIVGRLLTKPWQPLEISYRFRYDPRSKILRRNEVRTDLVFQKIRFTVGFVAYNFIAPLQPQQVTKSVDLGTAFNITPEWIISANIKQNYSPAKKFLVSSGGSIGYNGSCANLLFTLNKDYTHAAIRNFKQDTSFAIELHLKNIS